MIQTKSQLKSFADANLKSNGVNSNTGANHNTMLNNIIDSMLTASDNVLDLISGVARINSFTLLAGVTQITFSSALPNNNYQVWIQDHGLGHHTITDIQTTGFKVTGIVASGVDGAGYFAILHI